MPKKRTRVDVNTRARLSVDVCVRAFTYFFCYGLLQSSQVHVRCWVPTSVVVVFQEKVIF